MRKLILIAGLVLASASAQAGDRGLSLAPMEAPNVTTPAKAGDTSKTVEASQTTQANEAARAEAPKYAERPAIADSRAEAPQPAERYKAERWDDEKDARAVPSRPYNSRQRHGWSEARIISTLHRYGVYW